MLDIIWKLLEHKDQLAQSAATVVASVIAFCSILSTILPPASQPGAYSAVRDAVNKVGQNYGHAKNANGVGKPPAPFI